MRPANQPRTEVIIRHARWFLIALTLVPAACGGASHEGTGEAGPAPAGSPRPAPWSAPALAASDVPPVYLEQWRAADNRRSCAILAPRAPEPAAEPRAATFGGGWGVAYDLPDLRSAYGVAGTGVVPSRETYDEWPHRIRWADGSEARYGPEGGTGPTQLAYLTVAGQGCLYNVWSRLGVEQLERLLDRLRFVEAPSP